MMPWVGVKSETNDVEDLGVLKTTSGNVSKRLKTRTITRVGKSELALIMKQITTKEYHVEKGI